MVVKNLSGGWRALTSGFVPTVARSFPANAIGFLVSCFLLEWKKKDTNGCGKDVFMSYLPLKVEQSSYNNFLPIQVYEVTLKLLP